MKLLKIKIAGVSVLLLVVAAIALASMGTVVALTVTQATRQLQVRQETVVTDTDTTVIPIGWRVASTTVAASGTTYATKQNIVPSPYVVTSNGVSPSAWYYRVDLQEAQAAAWATTTEYSVKIYFDGALQGSSGTTTIFLSNLESFPSTVEGTQVEIGYSSSSTIPTSVVVQVERTNP